MSYEREILVAEREGAQLHEQKVIAQLQEARGMQELMMDFVRKALNSHLLLDETERLIRRQFLIEAMERNKWNACRAARQLGVHRNTLTRMMEQSDIHRPGRGES